MKQMSKNKILARTTHVGTHPCPPDFGWEILTKRSVRDDILDVFVILAYFKMKTPAFQSKVTKNPNFCFSKQKTNCISR